MPKLDYRPTDYRPTPPVRRDVELEQRPLYQPGSQTEACLWSGEDEGEFSRQIDPENPKVKSDLFKTISQLYGDSFADRKLQAQGKASNIVWGKVGIIVRYAELFTGRRKPSCARELRTLTEKLSDTISDVMKMLPELNYGEQMEASNRVIKAANDLVNAATAFRDGLRHDGIEDCDGRILGSEHIS